MGEVVQLQVQPKSLSGSRRNVSWVITYIPATREWEWTVTVSLTPEVFTGKAKTQAAAEKEVERYLKTMTA